MNQIKKFAEDSLEKLEKDVSSQVQQTTQAVKGQVKPGASNQSQQTDQGTSEQGSNPQAQNDPQGAADVVKSFYEPSHAGSKDEKKPSEFFKDKVEGGMEPDDAAKLESLRNKLHKETYYIPLTQRKTTEQEQVEEEQVEEEEKKMEELKLEEDKKKDDDIAIRQAAQKTEKFPGASG